MKIGSFKRSLTAAALGAALGWGPAALLAAVIPVTNLTDSDPGSLRAAIAAATPGDTIDATGISGTITLTSDLLLIGQDLTLKGPGASLLTVSGNDLLPVFRTVPGKTVTISGLTIARGRSYDGGAGIFNDRATLTVDGCTLTQNSELSGEGGGAIYNFGGKGPDLVVGNATLTLLNSTISHNRCSGPPDYTYGFGGGVINEGAFGGVATLTAINSTFSQNSAGVNGEGGAIFNSGAFSGTGTATIMNCTFSQNEASWGSGIGNDVAFSGTASVQIGSSILANSTSGPYIDTYGGTVTSLGYNLSDNATGPNDGTTDLLSTNPLLGPLQDNGGPTFTHALLNLSPAINAGDPASTLATDQRGFPRPVDGRVDIGAFESRSCLPHVTVMNANDSGYGSLRQALADICQAGTIDFAPSLHGKTITLTSGQLVVPKTYTINGPGADLLTISGNQADRVFFIPGGTSAWISGLTIAGGVAPNDYLNAGGGIYVVGRLTLDGCTIRDNRTQGSGGGIYNSGSGLTLRNCTLSGNSAGTDGGGIANSGRTTMVNSTLSGNSAAYGGGISTKFDELRIEHSTITRNIAQPGQGGGLYFEAGAHDFRVTLSHTIVAGNGSEDIGRNQLSDRGVISSGYNLIGNTTLTGNLIDDPTDLLNTDPLLGPLQDNGGPTFTHALLAGSPALNAGDPASSLTLDQRGLPRPVNGRIDIGAFESQTPLCDIPTVTITGPASGAVFAANTAVTFAATFTGDSGPHTAQWNIDGNVVAGTVNESTHTVTTTVTFSAAGVYAVQLTVANACGNSGSASTVSEMPAMVVIYDPSAGFVTGGGWINSPAGASVQYPTAVGKASFGFVSKYKKGMTVPTGETEFQFKAGNLKFNSTSYEWLVVSGARAQYKGAGTINGAPGYGFLLTAIDGQVSGGGGADKFRIKIWNSGGVVYDNQMGADDSATPSTGLGGGSIVIHK